MDAVFGETQDGYRSNHTQFFRQFLPASYSQTVRFRIVSALIQLLEIL